jgi:hypothetical protein
VTPDARTIDPADTAPFFDQPGYSPYARHSHQTRRLQGEQHPRTFWSGDAIAGGIRVGPREALDYARGAAITSSTGQAGPASTTRNGDRKSPVTARPSVVRPA